MDSPTTDLFMHRFKELKKRKPAPDLSEVIDFYTGANVHDKVRTGIVGISISFVCFILNC